MKWQSKEMLKKDWLIPSLMALVIGEKVKAKRYLRPDF